MKSLFQCLSLLVILLFSGSGAYAADSSTCAKDDEFQAMHVRALQSELMVAALSCDLKDKYTDFAMSHSDVIKSSDRILKSYFKRSSSKDADEMRNNFITGLANYASNLSLTMPRGEYCKASHDYFDYVQYADPKDVAKSVNKRYYEWHDGVKPCGNKS